VLRGYLQWGDKVAERLNGMFALNLSEFQADSYAQVIIGLGLIPYRYWRGIRARTPVIAAV